MSRKSQEEELLNMLLFDKPDCIELKFLFVFCIA